MSKREIWIDTVKAYACVLVVLCHFFQSMTASDILSNSFFLTWLDKTVYYYHVPLFFICSGYLHQAKHPIRGLVGWKNIMLDKLIGLGMPYLFFSSVTWVLKMIFSGSVNYKADGYFTSIFLRPISPYWYLYTLLLLYLIIPSFNNNIKCFFIILLAFILKLITLFGISSEIYALDTVMQNSIWFILGMAMRFLSNNQKLKCIDSLPLIFLITALFMTVSISLYDLDYSETLNFVMGIIGCAVTLMFAKKLEELRVIKKASLWASKYTLPVFLMHTIFAAPVRVIVDKIGIGSATVHVILGLLVSFIGPIIAIVIIKKIKYLDFIIYPNKYIKRKNNG